MSKNYKTSGKRPYNNNSRPQYPDQQDSGYGGYQQRGYNKQQSYGKYRDEEPRYQDYGRDRDRCMMRLKRALEDLRFQNEENINTINVRNEENAELGSQVLDLQHQLGEKMAEIEDLHAQMAEVERKNVLLNDKINEIIYRKAANYKERTLEVLRKNPE